MQPNSSSIAKPKGFGRSAVSNGTRLHSAADGRTRAARRFRDLVGSYCAALGTDLEALPEPRRMIVRQAAGVALQCEAMQQAIVNGEPVDTEQMVRLSNLLVRLLKNLGLGPDIVEDEPDLSAYLRGRAA